MDINDFISKLKVKFNDYTDYFTVIEYINAHNVIIKDKHGLCKTTSSDLYSKGIPTIASALDKNNYFIEKAKNIHNDIYNYHYVKYVNAKVKIDINCKLHGIFSQTPCDHLNGHGCPNCGSINTAEKITTNINKRIEQFKIKHRDRYDYSLVKEMKSAHNKIDIICKIHGIFKQTIHEHLKGYNCLKCSYIESSKNRISSGWNFKDWFKCANASVSYESFKFYIIKCWDENETFYKVGRTFNTIKRRFSNNCLPYSYEILKVIELKNLTLDNCKYIYTIESLIKKQNKKFKYKPKKHFEGYTECFFKLKNYDRLK